MSIRCPDCEADVEPGSVCPRTLGCPQEEPILIVGPIYVCEGHDTSIRCPACP